MIITSEEIKELAKFGREYVLSERGKNIIRWVGHLPEEEEINYFFENLEEASEWGEVDPEEKLAGSLYDLV
jgi:hypothetical protein